MNDKESILIIDDDESIRRSLTLIFGKKGYEKETAGTGREAMEKVQGRFFNLALLDIKLPDMEGVELIAPLKEMHPDMVVIMVTAYASLETAVQALNEGASAYITKPLNMDEMLVIVGEALEKQRLVEEKRRAEEALRESEERFRDLYENAPNAYFSIGADGLIHKCNRRAGELLGYAVEELVGRPVFELYADTPQGKEKASKVFQRFKAGETITDEELQMQKAHGTPVWISLTVNAVRDDRGQIVESRSMMVDITKRKRAEEEIAELARFPSENPTPVLRVAKDGAILYANKASLPLLDVWGCQIGQLLPDDWREFTLDVFSSGLGNDAEVEVEDRILSLTFAPVVDADYVNVYGLDITERKRAEQALAEERNLLRTLIDNLPDYIYAKDTEGRFVLGNIAAAREVGATTPDEMLGKTDFDFFPEELAAEYYADEQVIFRSGQPLVNREEPVIDHAGNRLWVLATKVPLRDSQGQIVGLVGMNRDITERKQLEAQLRQAQKMEAVGRLASGVAHDFNNLLTVITGFSELLLHRHLDDHDPLREPIEQIHKAGERAASLTRQLLAFSRKQVLQLKVLDLNAVVTDMDKMLRRLIGEDIELVTVPGLELGPVKADPGQIEQVIVNLAVNARDAMPQGGKLTIETANVELDEAYAHRHVAVQPGPYVMLAVSDTGVGMDAETQSHIFEPFFTTKEEGTGLGLSTVYGIVKQSGGHIWVYSEPGQGTTFKIYLPRVEEAVEPLKPSAAHTEPPRGSEIVLVVEDDEGVRTLVREFLEMDGYSMLEACHGEQALQVCEQHEGPIHLMVTDVVMPGMSGRELAERLAPLHPEMKVLYISGYTDNAIVCHGVLEAGRAFLQKPFTTQALARKVRQVLDAPQQGQR